MDNCNLKKNFEVTSIQESVEYFLQLESVLHHTQTYVFEKVFFFFTTY